MNIWPQILFLLLYAMQAGALIRDIVKENRSKNGLVSWVIVCSIELFLLYMGGFFDPLLNR